MFFDKGRNFLEILQYKGYVSVNDTHLINEKAHHTAFINLPDSYTARAIPSVPEIRLRRTDTTLDLSQKAEKV